METPQHEHNLVFEESKSPYNLANFLFLYSARIYLLVPKIVPEHSAQNVANQPDDNKCIAR